MSDESSTFESAKITEEADVHGEVVLAQSISGFFTRKKTAPKRDVDQRAVDAARLVN